jgi:prevent-host-death family protein
MIDLKQIYPLSDFQRKAKAHIARLKKTGQPSILTVNGQASVVIQEAASYQKLVEELELARTLAAVESAKRGEGLPVKEAFALIRKRIAGRRKR